MKAIAIAACALIGLSCLVAADPADAVKTAATPSARPILKFQSYDGDPAGSDPKELVVHIRRLDVQQPTAFIRIGDVVPGTKWKLTKFTFKENGNRDVSEVTLVHVDSRESMTLVFDVIPK